MSAVVGIDLSTRAIDVVKLDENSNRAEWERTELNGKDSWERTLNLRREWMGDLWGGRTLWWDDVYLVAIEAPYGRGQPGTSAILNRVVGAVAATLPARLRAPERCWLVRPDEWKSALGLKGKPTLEDLGRLAGWEVHGPQFEYFYDDQNALDACCIALFARDAIRSAVTREDG